ncbi:MAG: hypothetical protein HY744_19130 [Deltaproteobacteria bacterium]|nr:hypothetical protein [Deltaproteobacteria bacterium]
MGGPPPGPSGKWPRPNLPLKTALDKFLDARPLVRDSIIWEEPSAGDTPTRFYYVDWQPKDKQFLSGLFDQLMNKGPFAPLVVSYPKPGAQSIGMDLYFTRDQAFEVYAAHLAWALYLEAEGVAKNMIHWKLMDMTPTEREELLCSYRYHARIKPPVPQKAYPPLISPGQSFQPLYENQRRGVLRGDPRVGYKFLAGLSKDHPFQQMNLIGSSMQQTLANITFWMHSAVDHGPGGTASLGRLLLTERLKPVQAKAKPAYGRRSCCVRTPAVTPLRPRSASSRRA